MYANFQNVEAEEPSNLKIIFLRIKSFFFFIKIDSLIIRKIIKISIYRIFWLHRIKGLEKNLLSCIRTNQCDQDIIHQLIGSKTFCILMRELLLSISMTRKRPICSCMKPYDIAKIISVIHYSNKL